MPGVFETYYGVQTTRTNLITNPSFETNTTGWGPNGGSTLTRTTTQAKFGTYSAAVSRTSTSGNAAIQMFPRLAVNPSTTYTYSVYLLRDYATTRTMQLRVSWYNSGGTQIGSTTTVSVTPPAINTWGRFSITLTSPSTAATVLLDAVILSANVGESLYADGFMLEQSSTLGFYFDGSTYVNDGTIVTYAPITTAWTGTANASTSTIAYQAWTLLSNVQEINCTIGRRLTQDVFTPSSASVTVRYPSGFASPITQISIGSWWQFRRVGTTNPLWSGKLRDARVEYGIPYASSTGPADYLMLDLEGAMADWGRSQGNNYAMAAGDINTQGANATAQSGLAFGSTYTTYPALGSATISGSWLEWWNLVAQTLGTTLKDGSGQLGIYTKDTYGNLGTEFSDTTNDATHQVYDQIEYRSMAADYWTRIQVETVSYGNVTASTGSAPYRTLPVSTVAASASQASDIANYWLGIYADPSVSIFSISCLSEAQSSWNLGFDPYAWYDIIGYKTAVTFRGTTANFTILGATFTATPDSSRFTYYLAPADMTPYLVLDSPTFGILNTNKLSW